MVIDSVSGLPVPGGETLNVRGYVRLDRSWSTAICRGRSDEIQGASAEGFIILTKTLRKSKGR